MRVRDVFTLHFGLNRQFAVRWFGDTNWGVRHLNFPADGKRFALDLGHLSLYFENYG